MPHDPEVLKERLAEAARYALLRRMAPAMRHDMAGALQPVSMMAAMLEKRLQKPDPDLVALGKNGTAINTLAREASLVCMNLMTWLAPREDVPVAINKAVAESLGLVATEMSFRGINFVNETGDATGLVLLSGLRGVFMASLLALTDELDAPSDLRLTASATGDDTVLSLRASPSGAEAMMAGGAPAYRKLGWDDVDALAQAQGVGMKRDPGWVELRFRN